MDDPIGGAHPDADQPGTAGAVGDVALGGNAVVDLGDAGAELEADLLAARRAADAMRVAEEIEVEDDGLRPRVRADLLTPSVVVVPGEPVTVTLQILNTSEVIETLDVELLGLMADRTTIEPRLLTLFPDEAGEVTVTLEFHATLPAGEHEGLLLVSSVSDRMAPAMVTLVVEVPATPSMRLQAEPPVRTGGRKTDFELQIINEGNAELPLQIRAADANRQLALHVDNPAPTLRVDQTRTVPLHVRGRRPWTGTPVEHVITVDVTGGGLAETAEVRFRQKPRLTAGIITILTLALIVTLWALAMLFGVQGALAPAPPTRIVPESFGTGVGLADLDPASVGGALSGTITVAATAQPVARATIEAYDRQGRLVGATATGDDGTFELGGLLPVRHRLRIRAPGFQDLWWPAAATAGDATPLLVTPAQPQGGVNAGLVGLPGALGGEVIAGDGDLVPITVEVLALDLVGEAAEPVATVADERGTWAVGGLVAPATYRITYRAEGYAPVEIIQPLEAGQQLVVNTTRLPAAAGSIRGVVRDRDGNPIGGVEVLAQRGDTVVSFVTPTSGLVGSFNLEDLETPGTYLLTFVAEGFAQETSAVPLGPGEDLVDLDVVLSPATGVVTGSAVAADGTPLGGVQVTVSGGGTALATETLTSGAIGTFRLAGLPLPGVYAVTFDLDGYVSETVRVELDGERSQALAEVTMTRSLGDLVGRVVDASTGQPLGAVEIEVSDGSTVRTTTTASVPQDEAGTFRLSDLPPGSYTITARPEGGDPVTVLEEIRAATVTTVEIQVGGSA